MKQPILTGAWGKCHIQGITADHKNGFVYYSFTTKLVKAKMDGTVVGCVDGLMGHLGCIDFNEQDGRVYGSLEYKNDSIGKGILKSLGSDAALEDAFYIAIFDVDKIDRMDMDAEKDGIMTGVYLKEVVEDYNGTGKNGAPHKYGCSGIDGTSFGPIPGKTDGKQYLFVAYGVYGDVNREDNDHQVLLCYDPADWKKYERPISQAAMHRNGPAAPTGKFFVYTGNTTYGVQNLEYDAGQNAYFMAVYTGKKPRFPNYPMFAVDASVAPKKALLKGLDEEGLLLTLKTAGKLHEASGISGWNFNHGTTGLHSAGNGDWLICHPGVCQSGQCGAIWQYVFDEKYGFVLKD